MKPDIKSPASIQTALKGNVNAVEKAVKPTDKKRKFPGSTTDRGYGPVMNPSLKNTMSSVVGGAGEASAPASAPAGGATGGVMASVEGGSMMESSELFFNFLESITTNENTSVIVPIIEAYCIIQGIPFDE